MTDTIKILDRIKKLLALSQGRGGSANEISVAAAEAARLMQLHKLTEADIPSDGAFGPDMVDLPAGADFLDSWKFVLVTCVARSFMCEAVGLRAATRRKVRVVGRREDVEVVLEVYRHLAGEIERLTASYEGEVGDFDDEWADIWSDVFGDYVYPTEMSSTDRARANIERRDYSRRPNSRRRAIDPGRREVYRDGLVAGIATKLKEQKVSFEESGEKALVVARKSREEIRNHIATKFADPRKVERAMPRAESVEEIDFARGFIRGQSVVVPQKMKKDEESVGEAGKVSKEKESEKKEDAIMSCGCGHPESHWINECPTPGSPLDEVIAAYEAQNRPPSILLRRRVVVQKWEESERGWGCRPDGYSIHPDEDARKRYVKAYWDQQPDEAPDEYSRPSGTPYEAEVEDVVIEGDGRRYYEHEINSYPGDGGIDGWVSPRK